MAPTSSPSRAAPSSSSNRKLFSSSIRITSPILHKICPICLNLVDNHKPAVLPHCFHAYCFECIKKWSNLKRNCPLCNTQFDSWFVKIRVSSDKLVEEQLPDFRKREENSRDRTSLHRELRRSMYEAANMNQQSRPLPWRRSFGRSRFVPYGERERYQADVAERVRRWRASIYRRRLQAVPFPPKKCQEKNILWNSNLKHRMQQRIEPWIRRELQAIVVDPEPSIIVHLATSLYILSVEEKLKPSSKQPSIEDKYVEQLRPFLQDQANMFWHELRCFAESSFEMTTYDSVVEYKQLDQAK